MKKLPYILLLIPLLALAAELGTIYVHLDLGSASIGVGTETKLEAIIDSIRTGSGGTLWSAGPCLREYQSFRLHSLSGRPLVDLDTDTLDNNCTGSPCYRSIYTHSSPFDLDRELVARACYFLASDSLDSAIAFLRSDYAFMIQGYRPGNTEISMTERYVTMGFEEFRVVSDTVVLNVVGPPMNCVPLKPPQCLEIYDITPLAAKGIWQHVMLHDGYQYWVSSSPNPPASGTDIDTNYIELDGLVPETSYYLHVRAWAYCESMARTYSDWSSILFNTYPSPITTIRTSPVNLQFWADSVLYSTTQEFVWPYEGSDGPCHWLEAVSPQSSEPGPIYMYNSWSDGGTFYHCYQVGPTNTTVTCYFDSIDADFIEMTAPESPVCASTVIPVSVTMRNSGSLDWTDLLGISLASQNPPLNKTWGISKVLFMEETGAPGEEITFNFTVTSPSTAGTYVFEWEMHQTDVGFFGDHTDSVLITVLEKPVASASNDGPYCAGDTVQLTGGPSGMAEYKWTGPNSFSSTEQSPNLGAGTTTMNGTYRLVVTNALGCTDTAWTAVNVYSRPAATAMNSGPYCAGQTIRLSSMPFGMTSYEWSGPLGFTSTDQYPRISDATTEHSGTYTVIITNIAGCKDTATTDVTVFEKPELSAHSNAPICDGERLELWAEPDGLASYFWHYPDGSVIPRQVVERDPASADMSGLYFVIATNTHGCSDTATIEISVDTVFKKLTIDSLTADSLSITEGYSTYLHCYISGDTGIVSYIWTPDSSLSSANSPDPLAMPTVTTTYTVTVVDSQNCGVFETSDSITITVIAGPPCPLEITDITPDTTICNSDSVQLSVTATGAVGEIHYNWSPSSSLSDSSIADPIAYPCSATTYRVTVSDDSCSDNATVQVDVRRVRLTVPDSIQICRGDTIELSAEMDFGAEPIIWNWLPDDELATPDSDITLCYPYNSTIFNVIAIDISGCADSAMVKVGVDTILTTMNIHAVAFPERVRPEEGTLLSVLVTGDTGDVTINWTGPEIIENPSENITWAYPPDSCWYVVTVSDSQKCGTFILTDSVFVAVSPCSLITYAEGGDTICRGDSVFLSASVVNAVGPVNWLWQPTTGLDDSTSQNPTAKPDMTTHYTVTATDTIGCADNATVIVAVKETPTAVTLALEETLYVGEDIKIMGFPNNTELSYYWRGPAGFEATTRNIVIEGAATVNSGWYILTVTNTLGCSGSDSTLIIVRSKPDITISPNALYFDLFYGDTAEEQTLDIGNIGDTTLTFTELSLICGLPCFSFAPESLLPLVPAEAETILVTFSETEAGTFHDTLRIVSNDPDEAITLVPLRGRVHAPDLPELTAIPDIVNFGKVLVDSCETDSVLFSNTGGSQLIVYAIDIVHSELRFIRPLLPDSLDIGKSHFYVFEYCPTGIGSLYTWIGTASSDTVEPTLALLAIGLGVISERYSVNTEVITPNGDGKNDVLRFAIPDWISDWRVFIYDYKGRQIKSGRIREWDGMDGGRPVAIGTYYYRVTVEGETVFSGAVSVIY